MKPLPDLGRALAELRSLRGLSIADVALAVGASEQAIQAAERGEADEALTQELAANYGIDASTLRNDGFVEPVAGVDSATVFLLHGGYQDFDAQDLGVLERAMRAGRLLVSRRAEDVSRALMQRLQFVPVSPAGPGAADAARQGHRLARSVRARLGWGNDALGDVRALLEEQLGVAVVVEALETSSLRAASILDADRTAAAAVLAENDPQLSENPLLARVYLAHELCHLLFDPGTPGCVRVDLEDPSLGDRTTGSGTTALLESRAKGFAAELLMPYAGLQQLLGPPKAVASEQAGLKLVADTRNTFGTPWEIACWHLRNHGFVAKEMVSSLRKARPPGPTIQHRTTLPKAGRGSLSLLSTAQLDAEISKDVPSYVEEARRSALAAGQALTDAVLADAESAVEAGRPIAAVDGVVDRIDDLLHAHDIAGLRVLLEKLDPEVYPPEVSTAALMTAMHGPEDLSPALDKFRVRVETALRDRWSMDPEQLESTMRRLR